MIAPKSPAQAQYEADVRLMLEFIGNDLPTTSDRLDASAAFHRLMTMLKERSTR